MLLLLLLLIDMVVVIIFYIALECTAMQCTLLPTLHQKYCDALRVALRSGDDDKVTELFSEETAVPRTVQMQMCYMLGRHRSK